MMRTTPSAVQWASCKFAPVLWRAGRWAVGGALLAAVGNVGALLAEESDTGSPPAGGRGSVVVVTVESPGELEEWLRGEASRKFDDVAVRRPSGWWLGEGLLGSNDPLRSIYGLFSGIPPLRIGGQSDIRSGQARQLLIPVALAEAGGSVGGRVDGFPGQWPILRRMLPGVQPLVTFRRVLLELGEVKEPFFYWLSMSRTRGARGASLENRIRRILDTLETRQALARTMIVVTSVHGSAAKVPLAIFFPAASHACAAKHCTDALATQQIVPLEVVGTTLRQHLNYRKDGPAMAPGWRELGETTVSRRETRIGGILEGVSVSTGVSTVSVLWQDGGLRNCWRRSQVGCRWTVENPSADADVERRLESVLLLELEKILSRTASPQL